MAILEKHWDVLALGNVAVDDLLYVPAYPPPDTKTRIARSQRQCGGLAATALVAAARLGARCAYAGVLGDNELSHFVEAALRSEGIEISHVVRHDDALPTHSTIIVDVANGTRNIFFEARGRCGADETRPGAEIIRSARVLLIDPWGEAGMLRAAKLARENEIAVVADIERDDFDAFAELFALADHPILSQEFALQLTGASTPEAAARAVWNETRHTVVVTCGEAGGVAISREYSDLEPRRYPSFPVKVVDTTGCGDVFHGAYAAALAQGCGVAERLRMAAAAAALKATRAGGQAGIPMRAALQEFLSQTSS
jgi:sugar/nucleoside kinase (ribokinase family)